MAALAEQLLKIPKLLAKFKTLEHTGARLFDVGVLTQTQTLAHTHTGKSGEFYLRISYVFG